MSDIEQDHQTHAAKLLDDSTAIDCRDPSFLLSRFTADEKPEYWEAISASGLTSIVVDAGWVEDGLRDTAISVAGWYERIRANDAILAETPEDIVRAKQNGQVAFVLSLQSPTAVEEQSGFVEVLYRMGIRMMQVAYQRRNLVAEGCGERGAGGFSKHGLEVLAEMNRVGMVVDLAHANDATMDEAIELSEAPVVNSHAGARALVDHPRNMTDSQISALAERGGVFCVSAYSAFIKEGGGRTGTSLHDYLRHVDHALDLVGEEHVGVGFDVGENRTPAEAHVLHSRFGETGAPPAHRYVEELTSRRDYHLLIEAFVQAGYDDKTIQRLIGENLLSLFERVWK